jgi:hypothetical protein
VSDIYYSPEKLGLKTIGQVDWSDGNYCFDYTVVWQRQDGSLVYGDDAGCSCPSPFESQDVSDLTACTPAELRAHLEERQGHGGYDRGAEAADLMYRVMRAVSIPGSLARDHAAIEG